ncbi:MAG TPA: zinc-dependent alcohol dehydrogenase family protein [Chloroflexota bacterium]|nr:zinc-dependent alcohol dehydrogenase family protein [Chloroflexota bacterium]
MKAAVFHGKHDLRVEDVPVPGVGPDEVLIEVAYSGICGSDLHIYDGMELNIHARPAGPRVLGHEVSGVVAEVGASVTTCRPGDRVTCIPWVTCGTCAYCRRGLVNHCTNKTLLGGTMAEYVVAPQGSVYRVPDVVPLRRAALAEPLSCSVWALDLAKLRSGEAAVVVGAGTMGLLIALLASRGGAAQVIVSEPNPIRRELAARLGATATVDPREGDLATRVRALTDDLGADVAFEVVGHPATVRDALSVVRNAGTVVVVGVSDPAATLPIAPYEVYQRELTIRGCLTRRLSFDRAMHWLGVLDLDPVITHAFPLADLDTAMAHARGAGGKVLLVPGREL